ncbi:MAG: hypothetical protein ACTSU5_16825 [Promethearchaeota archaeon]
MEDNPIYRDEIPSQVFIALGRRGREKIATDQCFLPGCENEGGNLNYFGRRVEVDGAEGDERVTIHLYYDVECGSCGGKFTLLFKCTGKLTEGVSYSTIKEKMEGTPVDQPLPSWWDWLVLELNFLDILDEGGKNLGNVGYW